MSSDPPIACQLKALVAAERARQNRVPACHREVTRRGYRLGSMKRRMTAIHGLIFFASTLGLVSTAPAQAPSAAAPVRVSGSTTVFTNIYQNLKEAISKDSGEAIEVISNGSRAISR